MWLPNKLEAKNLNVTLRILFKGLQINFSKEALV